MNYIAPQKNRCDIFDALIERRWGTSITPPNGFTRKRNYTYLNHHGIDESARIFLDVEDTADASGSLMNE